MTIGGPELIIIGLILFSVLAPVAVVVIVVLAARPEREGRTPRVRGVAPPPRSPAPRPPAAPAEADRPDGDRPG